MESAHGVQVNLQYVMVVDLDKVTKHQTCTFILQGKIFHFPPQDQNLKMSPNQQFPFRSSKVLLCYFEDEESTPQNFLEAPRVKNPCSYENIPNLWCPKVGSTIQLR